MVYVNMVLAHGGATEFARLARAAGAAGVIVPDLPTCKALLTSPELENSMASP